MPLFEYRTDSVYILYEDFEYNLADILGVFLVADDAKKWWDENRFDVDWREDGKGGFWYSSGLYRAYIRKVEVQ